MCLITPITQIQKMMTGPDTPPEDTQDQGMDWVLDSVII